MHVALSHRHLVCVFAGVQLPHFNHHPTLGCGYHAHNKTAKGANLKGLINQHDHDVHISMPTSRKCWRSLPIWETSSSYMTPSGTPTLGEDMPHYQLRGLLSRNIVIESGEPALAYEESFGCVLRAPLLHRVGIVEQSGLVVGSWTTLTPTTQGSCWLS